MLLVYVCVSVKRHSFYFFLPVTLSSNGPDSEAVLGLHTRVLHEKPVSVSTSTSAGFRTGSDNLDGAKV